MLKQCRNCGFQSAMDIETLESRLKPTELCDGNYHRNKKMKYWLYMASHPFIKSNVMYMVFPLRDEFSVVKGLLD